MAESQGTSDSTPLVGAVPTSRWKEWRARLARFNEGWEAFLARFNEGREALLARLNEGRCAVQAAVDAWSPRRKTITLATPILLLLVAGIGLSLYSFLPLDSPPTPTPYWPDQGILAHCDASSIPVVTYSPSNPNGQPRLWDDSIFLIPCYNADKYNDAIVQQVYTELERGVWEREEDTYRIRTKGGENAFADASIQFALIAAKAVDSLVTAEDLANFFGMEFNKTKCLQLNETVQFFACTQAVLTESADQTTKAIFESEPSLFMQYIQSKVLLFSLLIGEYESAFRSIIFKRTRYESFRHLVLLAEANNHTEMADFLNGEDSLGKTMSQERVYSVMWMASGFLSSMDTCAHSFLPGPEETWSSCIFSNYGSEDLVYLDESNGQTNETVVE